MSQERFEQLEELKKQASEILRLPIDHQRVTLLAGLKLEHTRQLERLVAGAAVNPNELLAVSEAIEKLSPELPPPAIELNIVKPTDATPDGAGVDGLKACRRCGWSPPDEQDRCGRCYRCGWKRGDDFEKPWQPIDLTGGPSPEQPDPRVTSDVQAPRVEAANVVPLQPPRRDPGSIHDAPGARMRRTDYSGIAGGVQVYNPLEKSPDWDAKHRLPEPFWPVVG